MRQRIQRMLTGSGRPASASVRQRLRIFLFPHGPVQPAAAAGGVHGAEQLTQPAAGERGGVRGPVSGSNIQPVQLEDLDGDGEEEALAFFRNSADEKPLKIYIFTAGKQGYEQAAVIEGTGTSIYSIAYEDLDQDGRKELLVGWRVNTDLLALSVYTLRSGEPEELVQGTSYVKYAVNDLNRDGLWELVVLRADEEGNGIADYYCWQEEEFQLRTSARITSTMAELSQQGRVKSGVLQDGTPALFVTGVEESAWMVTDILTVKNGELVNILLSDVTGVSSEIAPFSSLYPEDINGDGITEVPHPEPIPAWGNVGEAPCRRIDWYTYTSDGTQSGCGEHLPQCGGRLVPAPAGRVEGSDPHYPHGRDGGGHGHILLPGRQRGATTGCPADHQAHRLRPRGQSHPGRPGHPAPSAGDHLHGRASGRKWELGIRPDGRRGAGGVQPDHHGVVRRRQLTEKKGRYAE